MGISETLTVSGHLYHWTLATEVERSIWDKPRTSSDPLWANKGMSIPRQHGVLNNHSQKGVMNKVRLGLEGLAALKQ